MMKNLMRMSAAPCLVISTSLLKLYKIAFDKKPVGTAQTLAILLV